MATSARPFVMTGAALVSAAAIATAAPSGLPGQLAGLPSPLKLSTAQYELTAIGDITIAGISDALTSGFGGFIGASDAFYPGVFNNDAILTGPTGVAYYLVDTAFGSIVPFHLDNYFFEVGSQSKDLVTGGLGAAAYVAAGSVFGVDSAPAQLIKSLVGGGGTGGVDIGAAIMGLTAGIPVVGDLTSVYFTGLALGGDTTDYGTGFAGVLAYASKILPTLGIDIKPLIGGISKLISNIGGSIGGHGWSHHDEGEGEGHDSDTEDTENESEHHGHGHSAAAIAATVAAPPAAAAAGVKPTASVARTAAAVGGDSPDTTPVAETTPDTGPGDGTECPDSVSSDSPALTSSPTLTNSKRSGQRSAASAAAGHKGSSHSGKRFKGHEGS